MEKRFQSILGKVNVTVIIPLEDYQLAILECPDLRKAIDKIAKKCGLDWAVETSGKMSQATLSHLCGPMVGENQTHEIEMASNVFMSKVSELKIPTQKEKECTSHEEYNEEAEVTATRVSICNAILEDMHKTEEIHIVGAELVVGEDPQHPLPIEIFSAGSIPYELLMEMTELYLDKYDHE